MRFMRSTLLVGEGRLVGALQKDGEVNFFIDTEGAVYNKSMQQSSRFVKKGGIVSYAENYTETPLVKFSFTGNQLETVRVPQ